MYIRSLPGVSFSQTHCVRQCSKTGRKEQNACPNIRNYWILPDTSGHSKGPGGHNAALKPGHDGRVELANSQYLLELHAAFVLPAVIDRKKQIPTGDPPRQRDFEPFIRKLTADELNEHPSAASATTESDIEIEFVSCTSAHKLLAAISPKWTEKPSRRLKLTS
jgi:hypothetical protein